MILALDPGLRTGWARSDGRCGTLDLSGITDHGSLFLHWQAWLADQLWCRRPELLLIERPFGRVAFTADLPIMLVGVAHMTAFKYQVPRRELTASAIKKAVTGNGRATKRAVIAGVALDGWQPDSDHAADACALLMAWRAKQVAEAGPRA